MKYLEIGMPRNGLQPIRGWITNTLRLVGDETYVDRDAAGDSWIPWNNGRPRLAGLDRHEFVTLEGFPWSAAALLAREWEGTVILVLRGLGNWVASGLHLGYSRSTLEESVLTWRDYVQFVNHQMPPNYMTVMFDPWVTFSDYRRQAATQLGLNYNGRAYDTCHGPLYSAFDGNRYADCAHQMNVTRRGNVYADSPLFQHLLRYGVKSCAAS